MYEIDLFAVGEGERSGDAIALRYTIPGRTDPIVGIIDAGFLVNGEVLAEHVPRYYGTKKVDFLLSTHPDGDHINGMGEVVRELDVQCLLIHRPAKHGYSSNSGSKPAEELATASDRARQHEPSDGGQDECLEQVAPALKPLAAKLIAAEARSNPYSPWATSARRIAVPGEHRVTPRRFRSCSCSAALLLLRLSLGFGWCANVV